MKTVGKALLHYLDGAILHIFFFLPRSFLSLSASSVYLNTANSHKQGHDLISLFIVIFYTGLIHTCKVLNKSSGVI